MNLNHYLNIKHIKKDNDWIFEYNNTSDDYVGLHEQKKQIKRWLNRVDDDYQNLNVIGPIGSGKTSLIQMLCKELNIHYYIRDSRNKRSKKDLQVYYEMIKSFHNCILIMDEMEMLATGEYMGISEIQKWLKDNHIKKDKIRIIFIVCDIHKKKMNDLLKYCKTICFDYPKDYELLSICSDIDVIHFYNNELLYQTFVVFDINHPIHAYILRIIFAYMYNICFSYLYHLNFLNTY